jgi:hypothetical protein
LIVDAADPRRLAEFWMAVLGWQPTGQYGDGVVEIADPSGRRPSLTFLPSSEPKTSKNRLHIDVNPIGCDQDDEVERVIGLGARKIDIGQGTDKTWVVLADPEGNEFCVLRRRVD